VQVNQLIGQTGDNPGAREITQQGAALVADLEDWLIQEPQAELPGGVQDYVSVPNRLLSTQYLYLKMAVDQDPPVTKGAEQRYAELSAQWAGMKANLDRILVEDVTRFNALLGEMGVDQRLSP
jgi:hypothetical protein